MCLQVKCFKYWPSEGVLLAHSLSIMLQKEEILPDYTIRTFSMTLKACILWGVTPLIIYGIRNALSVSQGYVGVNQTREVTQFHFTAWPDHGVPQRTDSMVEFVRRIRSSVLPSHGPIITHCR